MRQTLILCLFVVALLLAAGCEATPPATVVVTPTPPAPTSTPLPTWTPTPSPTPTPIAPIELTVRWPATVSPLDAIPIEVDLEAPSGLLFSATVRVTVMDPASQVYARYDLTHQQGARYVSHDQLRLPLEPLSGYWWLIAHVTADHPVVGQPVMVFKPEPVPYRPLTDTVPSEAVWRVPVGFESVVSQGDGWSGHLLYAFEDSQVGLWWAPGPTEALLLSNAVTMLEATHDSDAPAVITDVAEMEWQGRTAFRFAETWPGDGGGPATAWVIQGDSFWLYVLRVRALGSEHVSPLVAEVAATFGFVE